MTTKSVSIRNSVAYHILYMMCVKQTWCAVQVAMEESHAGKLV